MSRDKTGNKAGRREARIKARQSERDRKKIRGVRAEIHEAMETAAAMKRSKKKGTANLDINMRSLGWERVAEDGNGLPVEQKFQRVYRGDRGNNL